MRPRPSWFLWTIVLFASLLSFNLDQVKAQSAGVPAQPSTGSPYRVTRSMAGAAGHEEKGKLVMDDPRSQFQAGKDAKVIVYFEWEGPLGPHHFEGLWKSPEGKIVLLSDFRYEAKSPQYSGYWTMLLHEGTPSGEWSLEARIDGEPAGSLNFVITGSPVAHAPAAPQPLSLAELYRTATNASVVIEKLTEDGTSAAKSSGFWIGDGQLLTSFESIDGAASLRITSASGDQITTDKVLAWNRWQDWAVVKVETSPKAFLKRSTAETANVGDRYVFLERSPVGSKIADGSITGITSFPRAGSRLLVASGVSTPSIGGALLDEFGNYTGILGGSVDPSADPIRILALLNEAGGFSATFDWQTTGLAVPQSVLPQFPLTAAPTSLAELATRGECAPLVVKSNYKPYVAVASYSGKNVVGNPVAENMKTVFSRQRDKAAVHLDVQGTSKEKLTYALRLFTADNKMISASKPQEVSLTPGKFASTSWDLPIGTLTPGIYRIDLLFNDKTCWRDFIRVTD